MWEVVRAWLYPEAGQKEFLTVHCPGLSVGDLGVCVCGGGGLVYKKKSRRIYNQFKRNKTYFLLLNKLNRSFLGRRASSKSNYPVGSSAF